MLINLHCVDWDIVVSLFAYVSASLEKKFFQEPVDSALKSEIKEGNQCYCNIFSLRLVSLALATLL